jgi:hypothetical protein
LEPVHYPKPELERVLVKTLGVPLFQERAMRVAIECAGFTPGEADMLRKSMAAFKFTGGVSAFKTKLVQSMVANGYELELMVCPGLREEPADHSVSRHDRRARPRAARGRGRPSRGAAAD